MNPFAAWVLNYLLNSLWQVPMVLAAAWVAARLVRGVGARVEHRVWVLALALEVMLPACSVRLSAVWDVLVRLAPWRTKGVAGGGTRIVIGAGTAYGVSLFRLPPGLVAAIGLLYGGSLLYFAARLAWGWWGTVAMQRRSVPVVLEGDARDCWERVRGSADAEVRLSSEASGPVTVGVRRPALLVAPGWLETLDAGELEVVFAHEAAHMARHDFAKNLLYGALALPVAYHPALWMTRARMAETREIVCDAMAAEAVRGRGRYARSLLRLASMLAGRMRAENHYAIGVFDANILERRVMSLTMRRMKVSGIRRTMMAAACGVAALAACGSALALRMDVATVAQNAVSESHGPLKVDSSKIKLVSRVDPVYPAEARAKGDTVNGPVLLRVVIGKEGDAENIVVAKSLRRDYDRSAIDAVRQWRWQPYLLNGQPVEVDVTISVNFQIQP